MHNLTYNIFLFSYCMKYLIPRRISFFSTKYYRPKYFNLSKFVHHSRCSTMQKMLLFHLLFEGSYMNKALWSNLNQLSFHFMHIKIFKSNLFICHLYEIVSIAYSVHRHSPRNLKKNFSSRFTD